MNQEKDKTHKLFSIIPLDYKSKQLTKYFKLFDQSLLNDIAFCKEELMKYDTQHLQKTFDTLINFFHDHSITIGEYITNGWLPKGTPKNLQLAFALLLDCLNTWDDIYLLFFWYNLEKLKNGISQYKDPNIHSIITSTNLLNRCIFRYQNNKYTDKNLEIAKQTISVAKDAINTTHKSHLDGITKGMIKGIHLGIQHEQINEKKKRAPSGFKTQEIFDQNRKIAEAIYRKNPKLKQGELAKLICDSARISPVTADKWARKLRKGEPLSARGSSTSAS